MGMTLVMDNWTIENDVSRGECDDRLISDVDWYTHWLDDLLEETGSGDGAGLGSPAPSPIY